MTNRQKESSSFRDRSGFIFYSDDQVFRAVGQSYQESYTRLLASGLYEALTSKGLLIPHRELTGDQWPPLPAEVDASTIYKVLQVEKVPYISYPYEWCFQQLKDAALLTLQIQLAALEHNMVLKDASAFNVQFVKGRPVFIDTLSFDTYEEGKPWVAYRQFCTHFLAPLALMSRVDADLRRLSELYIDGIPLALASKLLPFKTWWSPFFQMHVHYHARLEKRYSADVKASQKVRHKLSKNRLVAIIQHLHSGINGLSLPISQSEWSDYYQQFSYSDEAIEHKKQLVTQWAAGIAPKNSWDLGCNTGLFSELLQPFSETVTAFDIDHLAIEKFYTQLKKKPAGNILPLVLDLNNPTAAIGWANRERKSFVERKPADLALALAFIHHLSISNNVPFSEVASLLSQCTQWLIIEFVPKTDGQAQRLLVTREDVFDDYTQQAFEAAFQTYFIVEKKEPIRGTERVLYLMKRK